MVEGIHNHIEHQDSIHQLCFPRGTHLERCHSVATARQGNQKKREAAHTDGYAFHHRGPESHHTPSREGGKAHSKSGDNWTLSVRVYSAVILWTVDRQLPGGEAQLSCELERRSQNQKMWSICRLAGK